MCEPLLCEPLGPPDNGIILPPCEVEFSSSCTILCGFGYELEGPGTQTCSLDASGDPEWSEAPICIGMAVMSIVTSQSNVMSDPNSIRYI